MNDRVTSTRVPQLDGLRAVAISLVLCSHTLERWVQTRHPGAPERLVSYLGALGVDVFFVLSGYLITTLLVRERELTGRIDLGAFYQRRVRRIFPAFYVFLGAMALLAALGVIVVPVRDFLASALYLRNYLPRESWTGHLWSLAVEEQFYLLWPALLIALGNARARSVAFAIIVASPLVRMAFYFAVPHHREFITFTTPTRFDMLMFGCALALVSAYGAPSWLRPLARVRVAPAAAIGVLAASLIAAAIFKGMWLFTIGYTINGVCCALILNDVLQRPKTALARFLSREPVTWLGRISYSLYLWQQPFFASHSLLGVFPFNLVGAILLACASYYWIEQPILRARRVVRLPAEAATSA